MERHTCRLVLRLFGYPEAELDGLPLRLARRKSLALLAYLGAGPQAASRETLAAMLWPGYGQEQSAAYLRQALWDVGKALGKAALQTEGQCVLLAPEGDVWTDVRRFEALVRTTASCAQNGEPAIGALEEAVALYRGDFMAGFTLRDSPDFDAWQTMQAEAMRRGLGAALTTLADRYAARGDLDMAIASVQRWLVVDPLDEAAHRELMQFYAWSGQRGAALRQYEACAAQLRHELNTQPEAATTELHAQIRSGAIRPRGKSAVVATPSPDVRPSLLRPVTGPFPASTPFVGREVEMAQIGRLLGDPDCRLLTLVGPGGIGKTRLAVQVAVVQASAYPQGVAVVRLATCTSGEQLIAAIAEELHISFHRAPDGCTAPEQERRQLYDDLRAKSMLLVLDNMDQLVDVAVLLSSLLEEAPSIKVLATSRERLGLPEEWVTEVQGLPCDATTVAAAPGTMEALSAAERLFVQCAQRARSDWVWQGRDRRAVARICQLVEGAPLGIELAAAWVGVLSCGEIATEMERDLGIVGSRRRGTPDRHSSLRAAFDHSWRLLGEAERSALAQLTVFRGGFTRRAAAQVARASLEVLSSLVDKSLLRREADLTATCTRYGIHRVLRQFAGEALARTPEACASVRERHRAYYFDRLESEGQSLMGPGQSEALESLNSEAGDLDMAVQDAARAGDWGGLREVFVYWGLFQELRGSRGEALEQLQPVLIAARAAHSSQPMDVASRAVYCLALALQRYFAMLADAASEVACRESLALARTLPDGIDKAFALLINSSSPGLPAGEAQELSHQSQAIFEHLGNSWGQATAYLTWADSANYGLLAFGEAEKAYRSALGLYELLGHRWGQALCLAGLASVAFRAGHLQQATDLALDSLALYQGLGNQWRVSQMRLCLARYAAALGDNANAERYHSENLAAALAGRQLPAAARYLLGLGELARSTGYASAARRYYEESLRLSRQVGDAQGIAAVSQALRALS